MDGLLWILLLQCTLAVIYGIYARSKKRALPLEKMTVTALIPILGILIPYLGKVFSFKKVDSLSDVFSQEEYQFKNDIRYLKKPRVEEEINTIPMEEALLINNGAVKRKLLMDTAKESAYEYINFLRLAISDNDIETSHYAASLIMEIKRNLQNSLQTLSVLHEQTPESSAILEEYLKVVEKYYHSKLLDEKNEERYAFIYSKLLEEQLILRTADEHWLEEKIAIDFKLKQYRSAEKWIDAYYKSFPDSERPYLLLLRHYYQYGNQVLFDKALRLLKDSHIKLSPEGLDMVRYWSDGSEA